jgi:hypothetical protein
MSTRTTLMTNEKANFEFLFNDIKRDQSLCVKDRNHDFAGSTLAYFNQCSKGADDHELWRECYMQEEMIKILKQRYYALNPHLLRLAKFRTEANLYEQMKYQQEVDDDGLTELRRDLRANTRYPNLDRKKLELLAAENYIYNNWGIRATGRAHNAEECTSDKGIARVNTNPVLTWRQFLKEFNPKFDEPGTIRKEVQRCTEEHYGNSDLPWAIGARAEGYLIVGMGEFRKNKNHPTPSVCKYQKDK